MIIILLFLINTEYQNNQSQRLFKEVPTVPPTFAKIILIVVITVYISRYFHY